MYNNHTQDYISAGIKTPEGWRHFIAGGRSKVSRRAANNTTARLTNNGDIAIKLHETDIVIVHADGKYTLNSGGWRSVTTKERINRYTPARLYQERSVWYITAKNGEPSLFYDGMVINADGTPVKPRATAKYEARLKLIKKQAKAYAAGFIKALEAGEVDMPSGGDCWGCSMRAADGSTAFGNSHLKQHIKERYYVPSLLVNAGREAGYRDEQIGMMGIGGHRLFINPERNIYKYMVKHLQEDL